MPIALKRLILIGLSFCLGLVVFYMPGRQYTSLHQVWLPNGLSSDRDDVFIKPVSSSSNSKGGIKFSPTDPAGPEFIEINADMPGMQPKACPDLFDVEEQSPTKCKVVDVIGASKVYGLTPRKSSPNMHVYLQIDKMLVALTGFDSPKEASTYLKAFGLVARRDVNTQLHNNKSHANDEIEAIKKEKEQAGSQAAQAYKHLPFKPVLPLILPAGWMQKMVRIDGTDPKHPTAVDIFYRKGQDRNISLSMVPAKSFQLGPTCGPTPNTAQSYLACSKVADHDYYAAGANDGTTASWYLYRQVGDAVAIVQVSAFAENGHPPLLLNKDLDAQALIVQSLRSTDKDSLEGATFRGHPSSDYPWIKP